MSRDVNAVRIVRAGSKTKRTPFALDYASWHAHLAGQKSLNVQTSMASARVVQLDYAAWYARLTGADRKAA